jgi:hypothetical protein
LTPADSLGLVRGRNFGDNSFLEAEVSLPSELSAGGRCVNVCGSGEIPQWRRRVPLALLNQLRSNGLFWAAGARLVLEESPLLPTLDDSFCADFRDRKAGKPRDFLIGISLGLELNDSHALLLRRFSSLCACVARHIGSSGFWWVVSVAR